MLNKTIAVATILSLAAAGIYISTLEPTAPYECYFWKLSQEKDLIICNYPGTTDMYHSYLTEKDLKSAMIQAGATYSYSGKHPSGLNYSAYEKSRK